jgi:8-oxo-dGTP pyrophosphatase MutT (NUDIX family)
LSITKPAIAGVAVLDSHNKLLVLHSKKGHLDLPKGKIDSGEDAATAARRELEEETGLKDIDISTVPFSFDYKSSNGKAKLAHFFVGKTTKREIKLSSEHSGYSWLTLEEAADLLPVRFRSVVEFLLAGVIAV